MGENYVNHTEVYMSCDIIHDMLSEIRVIIHDMLSEIRVIIHDMLSEIRVTITFGILVITHYVTPCSTASFTREVVFFSHNVHCSYFICANPHN